MSINLVIADDHTLVRSGMETLLAGMDGIVVTGKASDGVELLKIVRTNSPDVVLLDINMPNLNGIEACKLIREEFPSMGILFLSMHDEPEYVFKSMRAGGNGYLLKNVEKEELEKAIKTVAQGKKYYSVEIAAIIAEGLHQLEKTKGDEDLSDRELEVLKLVAEGKSSKQIAGELFLSIRTIETHRVNIMKKMRVANGAEMIKKALEKGII